jgi:hypothetical protein
MNLSEIAITSVVNAAFLYIAYLLGVQRGRSLARIENDISREELMRLVREIKAEHDQ